MISHFAWTATTPHHDPTTLRSLAADTEPPAGAAPAPAVGGGGGPGTGVWHLRHRARRRRELRGLAAARAAADRQTLASVAEPDSSNCRPHP